ncbi:conserved hypothetical protein [Paecilomyces variotii No. 5]|uniref:Uncharacterized protein n=1 Tax=Byssochlamys spectabilis (strain No. 5 / NBRC 109023) TaxID=1356009 RepID=V5FHF8_BYSSN|nr:conserved hypothetical protein [Paecilomyces variotii No. 5]
MSTPTVSGNPQFPTPVSAHDAHQDQGYFPPQSPQLAFNNDQQYSSKGFDRSSRDVVPGPPCYYPSYRDETLYGVPRSESWTEGTQSSDRWLTSRSAGGQIIWKPPNPVARPLPSRFSASEEPLSSLAALEPGISVSKYISNKSPENFARHIRDTDDWPSVMDDPIFRQIQTDCELISIEELISRRDEVYITHNVKVINAAEDGEITENTQDHSGLNIDTSDTTGVGYPAGRTDDGECFDVVSSQRYTEEKPKIHRRRKRVFDEMESSHPGGSYDKNSSGEQNSKPDEDTQQSDTQDKHPPQNYQRHTSMHKRPKWDNGFPSRNYHDRGFASNRPPQQNKIPRGLQISPDPKYLREKPQKRAHKSDLHPKDSEPKPQLSPQPRSEKNKRTQQTDSHESENDGPRRQDDDVNPKSKRIRPQTVSAYSRRW